MGTQCKPSKNRLVPVFPSTIPRISECQSVPTVRGIQYIYHLFPRILSSPPSPTSTVKSMPRRRAATVGRGGSGEAHNNGNRIVGRRCCRGGSVRLFAVQRTAQRRCPTLDRNGLTVWAGERPRLPSEEEGGCSGPRIGFATIHDSLVEDISSTHVRRKKSQNWQRL